MRSITLVTMLIILSGCGKVVETAQKQLDKTFATVSTKALPAVRAADPELQSENLIVKQASKQFRDGMTTYRALILYEGDPKTSNRFIRVTFKLDAAGEPVIQQMNRGAMEFSWGPAGASGAESEEIKVLFEEVYPGVQHPAESERASVPD